MTVVLIIAIGALCFAGGVLTERFHARRDVARAAEEERIAEPLPEPAERPAQLLAQPRPPTPNYVPRHSIVHGDITTEFKRIVETEFATTEDAT